MFEKAIIFAAKAHSGQKRKGTDIPFMIHPLEVASIVAGITPDEEMMCAAVLHDVIEDCKDVTGEGYTEGIWGQSSGLCPDRE